MPASTQPSVSAPRLLRRRPVLTYFVLTFSISWTAALAVSAPFLLRHQPLPRIAGILMFPVMLLGPLCSGLLLTWLLEGAAGLRSLFANMFRAAVHARWYAALLIPPAIVLGLLLLLDRFVSPAYAPNRFFLGVLFGIPAGIFEEIGWTGFALPRMIRSRKAFPAAILLGLLWSLWHLPVIDFLGAATPHRAALLPFFLAFALAMVAMRVLISWIYINTRSLLLAQLLHISSTGALVVFSPPRVSPVSEALWYAIYGVLLWTVVAIVVKFRGMRLTRIIPQGDTRGV